MNRFARSLFVLCSVAILHASQVATAAAAQDRYIVSGASGQLGETVVKELLRRGVPARNLILVSHQPEKLAEYAKQGATVRLGDVTKPETLVPAYTGGTKMLMISVGFNLGAPRSVLHKRAFDAAVQAGVKQIVYTSFIGAGTSTSQVMEDHRLSEAALKASGVQWTILQNGEYAFPRILTSAQKMVATGRAEVPPWERPFAPVSHEDCAAAAVAAFLNPAAVNQTYELTGPELVGTADIARVVQEIAGRKITVVAGAAAAAPAMPAAPPTGAPGAGGPPPAGAGVAPGRGAGGLPQGVDIGVASGVPVRTAAQLAANAARFKQLTGRDQQGLKQMLESTKDQWLKS
jgi:NAD(P)H dehydrogenase (quinone)